MTDPEVLTLDIQSLKVREMKLIAAMTGVKFGQAIKRLAEDGDETVVHALALVALRRRNPTATPDEAEEVDGMALMTGMVPEKTAKP